MHATDALFETIRWHLGEKHMVTCMPLGLSKLLRPPPAASGSLRQPPRISKSSESVQEATEKGLYKGHFYSLLQAREEELEDRSLARFVMLRNPWGRKEWSGEWSDGSSRRRRY